MKRFLSVAALSIAAFMASFSGDAQVINPAQPATGVPTAGTGISVTGQQVSVNYGVANSPFTGNLSAANLATTGTVSSTKSIAASTNQGPFNFGTLTWSDTNIFGSHQTSVNSFTQYVLQNSNGGTTASTGYLVSNDLGTATTFYGEFGINSSGFTGTGAFNLPSATYLTSTSGDLAVGTTTANGIHFAVNSAAADNLAISSTGVLSGTSLVNYEAGVNHVQTYATVAALRALSGCTVGSLYATQGYTAQADNGNGQYVCTSDTSSTDNGGSIIATSTNRLYLQAFNGVVSVKQFGAKGDGSTNDSTAVQAAYTYANTLNSATVWFPPAVAYKLNSTLTMFPNRVGTDGGGNLLDFSGVASGYAITFTQTNNDPNARPAFNKAHPIRNFVMGGNGGTTLVTAIDASDHNPALSGTVYTIAGIVIQDVGFQNFYRDIEFGNGAFLWTIIACNFYITGGSGYDASLLLDSSTNGGENIELISSFIGKPGGTAIVNNNANASVYAKGSSFDYNKAVVTSGGGYIDLDGYVESNTDTAYWFSVTGTNSTVVVKGTISVTGNKSAYEIFYSDSTATNGGLYIDTSLQFTGGVTYAPPSLHLATGTGRIIYIDRANANSVAHPAIGGSTNQIWNYSFEQTSLAEFNLSGSPAPARSSTVAHTGTYSLAIAGSTTNTSPGASKIIACNPGQYLTGDFWYQATALTGTSGTFYVTANYLDGSGTNATSSAAILAQTTTVGSWTHMNLSMSVPAPMGTNKASASFSFFGIASGTPIAYVDDVTLTCN